MSEFDVGESCKVAERGLGRSRSVRAQVLTLVVSSALAVLPASTAQASAFAASPSDASEEAQDRLSAPDCFLDKIIYKYQNMIVAEAEVVCYDGTSWPYPVQIQRKNSAGVWVTLARGTGSATYSCVGSATKTYRTGSTIKDRSVTAACG